MVRGKRCRFIKTFIGLIGFVSVVSLSFLIISYAHQSRSFPIIGAHFAVQVPEDIARVPAQAPTPIAAQPQPIVTQEPRFVRHTASEQISAQGYNYTVFVTFNDVYLAVHVSKEVDIEDAMPTIEHIVKLFDLAYENLPGRPPSYLFIEPEPSDASKRQIYYNFVAMPVDGYVANLYFDQGYQLPLWLQLGLEAYLTNCDDVTPLLDNELETLFQPSANTTPFGDAWFVPSLAPRNLPYEMRDIAYSVVRRWSEAQVLYKLVGLAQSDTHAFAVAFMSMFLADSSQPVWQFVYTSGDIEVITACGYYVFVCDNYEWTWTRITSFVYYMEASIEFIRDTFMITCTRRIPITLYPFGVVNIPESITWMAYTFGWDAPDVNFVTNDEVILASTSVFGTWAVAHEVAHIALFREFAGYHPHTWLVEGMAVLGELLFRDAFTGTRPYSLPVPLVSTIDNLARNRSGHILPIAYYREMFGREHWTYDEIGSFMLYMYRRFGMYPLLTMYRSDNYNMFEIAYDVFGYELTDLMLSWRNYLWPNGEPIGWW